ncbi:hypothetical protein, partial [Mesorhizobium norvegicum]|uniref:hypothetical protein n=1 Tax=Mesorhizobium norvegicum TaxID=1085774 RepID=UPI001AEE015D
PMADIRLLKPIYPRIIPSVGLKHKLYTARFSCGAAALWGPVFIIRGAGIKPSAPCYNLAVTAHATTSADMKTRKTNCNLSR